MSAQNPLRSYAQVLALSGMGLHSSFDDYHAAPMGDYGDLDDEWDEDEDDQLLADDEHLGGPQGVMRRASRVDDKIARLQARAASSRNPRQRRHLQARIRRLQAKQGRVASKAGRMMTRPGMHPSEAAQLGQFAGVPNVGGQILPTGGMVQNSRQPGYYTGDREGYADGISYTNFVERNPPAGEGVRIPLEIGGAELATFSFAPGAGSRTVAVAAATAPITFAGFRVYGVETIIQLQPTSEGLVSATLTNLQVNGGINLLYRPQNASFAGQGGTSGSATGGKETIAGLRQNPILEPNNTGSITATIRQDATNAAAINGTVQFALICRSITDNQSGRD